MTGTILGPFVIAEKLGEGGMGEVYRARDTRLDWDVALKMLPAAVADDAERLARFEREARMLAALNHPHVAGIHGIEEIDGRKVLVLELAAIRSVAVLPLADLAGSDEGYFADGMTGNFARSVAEG